MSRSGAAARSAGRQIVEIARARVAPMLLKGAGMRFALLCLVLAGCSLYLDGRDKKHAPQPDAPRTIVDAYLPECGPMPADAGACSCTNGQWWCNSCPWSSPEPRIACSQVGASCEYEDWEHGCSCTCDPSGWWSCEPETGGSTCPEPWVPDAGY